MFPSRSLRREEKISWFGHKCPLTGIFLLAKASQVHDGTMNWRGVNLERVVHD
jgi:hypothetical protein